MSAAAFLCATTSAVAIINDCVGEKRRTHLLRAGSCRGNVPNILGRRVALPGAGSVNETSVPLTTGLGAPGSSMTRLCCHGFPRGPSLTPTKSGRGRRAAAMLGAREVFFAVIATTAVLVAVFVPIAFLQGDVGRLFSEFALTMAADARAAARTGQRPRHRRPGRGRSRW